VAGQRQLRATRSRVELGTSVGVVSSVDTRVGVVSRVDTRVGVVSRVDTRVGAVSRVDTRVGAVSAYSLAEAKEPRCRRDRRTGIASRPARRGVALLRSWTLANEGCSRVG